MRDDTHPPAPIYSRNTLWMTALFGTALGGAVLIYVNARHVGRNPWVMVSQCAAIFAAVVGLASLDPFGLPPVLYAILQAGGVGIISQSHFSSAWNQQQLNGEAAPWVHGLLIVLVLVSIQVVWAMSNMGS